MSCLSQLPNEVLLIVLSYLNTVDLFQSFHNLNQRFNNLVYDSTKHVKLPNNVPNNWLEKYLPLIENRMEIFSFNEGSMRNICQNLHFLSNVRLINLQGTNWEMSMIITEGSLLPILVSSLIFLDDVTYQTIGLSYYTRSELIHRNANIDYLLIRQDTLGNVMDDPTSLCPSIIRLSVDVRSMRSCYLICHRANNLRHFKIAYIPQEFDEFYVITQTNFPETRASLVTLDITAKTSLRNVFERFVHHFKNSLKRLTFDIHCHETIDGEHLQSIYQPLNNLQTITFFIQCPIRNRDEYFHSFRSEWWIDEHRPPIYIQINKNNQLLLTTIPSIFKMVYIIGLSIEISIVFLQYVFIQIKYHLPMKFINPLI